MTGMDRVPDKDKRRLRRKLKRERDYPRKLKQQQRSNKKDIDDYTNYDDEY